MTSSDTYQHLVGQPKFLSKETYSCLILILSAFLYSVMGVFIKFATASSIPAIEQVFFRGVFQSILVVGAMTCYDSDEDSGMLLKQPFGATRVRRFVIARGMVGGLGFVLYYYTMSVLPIGDATALLSLNPIITALASVLFLGENLHPSYILAAVASAVGSVLIARPSFLFDNLNEDGAHSNKTLGYTTALLGTCCGSIVFILVRKAGKVGVHTLQLLFAWCFFGVLYSSLSMIGIDFVAPQTRVAWLYLLGICVFGSTGHFFLNYAGRFAPATLTSIIRSSGIVWAYAWEILVFEQKPNPMTILGAVMIFVAVIVVTTSRKKKQEFSKQKEEAERAQLVETTDDDEESSSRHKGYGST